MKTIVKGQNARGHFKDFKAGWDFLGLALTAFGGLGMEAVYAFFLEPLLYGAPMQEWSAGQNIAHWILTCITWGIVGVWILRSSRRECGFDLLGRAGKMRLWQWSLAALCVVLSAAMQYHAWGGLKFVREFHNLGALLFTFQYIYYAFETMLFMLIIVFGQRACEAWFGGGRIPYGGIVCGLTWGAAHIFTKGSLVVGLGSILSGFLFGSAYLLVNRDIRKAWIVMFLMFTL
ncbi:MAG: hypothetical protein K2P42_18120 [Lachnospiraceae bacterium]|jgi:hypothetical protein|nr:hypothetical protein [Lachnospiraceae bacterium]MDE6999161.1 hypothetical protein [Lachnospiraceae bacterium]